MPTKPVALPRWANLSGNVTQPNSGQQDAGWANGAVPSSAIENWLKLRTYEWNKYNDDLVDLRSVAELPARAPGFGNTDTIGTLCYGNGFWLAGGAAGKISQSYDGVLWFQRTTGLSNTRKVNKIAFGNGVFVAVTGSGGAGASTGEVAYSTDGITWTISASAATAMNNAGVFDVVYAAGLSLWVIVGDYNGNGGNVSRGATATTPGGTWTLRNLTGCSGNPAIAVAYDLAANRLIAVDAINHGSVSTNATSWSSISPPSAGAGVAQFLKCVNATFFFADNGGGMWSSPTGAVWTQELTQVIFDIDWNGTTYVAGEGAAAQVRTATALGGVGNWTARGIPCSGNVTRLIWNGKSHFIAGMSSGDITSAQLGTTDWIPRLSNLGANAVTDIAAAVSQTVICGPNNKLSSSAPTL